MSDDKKMHTPVPKNTLAFICAGCGAVSLDQSGICSPQGRGKRSDWCGSVSGNTAPSHCLHAKHTERYQCRNCGQVAVNAGLLCDPERMS